MRRIFFSIAALGLAGALFSIAAPAAQAGGGPCGPSEVEVRGRVTDKATGQPLTETTSVEIAGVSVKYSDGEGTNAASRWTTCLIPGTYKIYFHADDYRPEWYHDQPNAAAATVITVPATGPVIVNEALTPRGRVIAGRVTNANGVPKFASIGIWRQTSAGWVSIDGIGNDEDTGWYEFVVPGPGRYRVSASVDSHKSRFATSATHLSAGRIVTIGVPTLFVNDVHVRVPYCHPAPDFCTPPGFLT